MLGIRDSAATYRIGLDMHTSFVIQPCIFVSSDWRIHDGIELRAIRQLTQPRYSIMYDAAFNEKIAPYQNISAAPAYLQ